MTIIETDVPPESVPDPAEERVEEKAENPAEDSAEDSVEEPSVEGVSPEEPVEDPAPEAEPEAEVAPETGLDQDHIRLVEALLFAAEAPLDAAHLQERLPEGADAAALVAELEALYRPRGVNIVRVANGWVLRTAPDLAPRLNLERKVIRKLSRAATETLAIIAYHQPVTRAEIEEIRGVVISKGTLDSLMEAGWIAPKGRRQTPGRPVTWVSTEQFLLHFGLADIGDLPGLEELRSAGLIGPRPVTTLSENGPLGEMPLAERRWDRDDEPASDEADEREQDDPEPEESAPEEPGAPTAEASPSEEGAPDAAPDEKPAGSPETGG